MNDNNTTIHIGAIWITFWVGVSSFHLSHFINVIDVRVYIYVICFISSLYIGSRIATSNLIIFVSPFNQSCKHISNAKGSYYQIKKTYISHLFIIVFTLSLSTSLFLYALAALGRSVSSPTEIRMALHFAPSQIHSWFNNDLTYTAFLYFRALMQNLVIFVGMSVYLNSRRSIYPIAILLVVLIDAYVTASRSGIYLFILNILFSVMLHLFVINKSDEPSKLSKNLLLILNQLLLSISTIIIISFIRGHSNFVGMIDYHVVGFHLFTSALQNVPIEQLHDGDFYVSAVFSGFEQIFISLYRYACQCNLESFSRWMNTFESQPVLTSQFQSIINRENASYQYSFFTHNTFYTIFSSFYYTGYGIFVTFIVGTYLGYAVCNCEQRARSGCHFGIISLMFLYSSLMQSIFASPLSAPAFWITLISICMVGVGFKVVIKFLN